MFEVLSQRIMCPILVLVLVLNHVTTLLYVSIPQVLQIALKLNRLYSSSEPLQQLHQLLTPPEQMPQYLITLLPAALSLPPPDHPKHSLALHQAATSVASACGLQEGCSGQVLLLLQSLLGPGVSLSLQEGLQLEEELLLEDAVQAHRDAAGATAACDKLPLAKVHSDDQDNMAGEGSGKRGMLSVGGIAGGRSSRDKAAPAAIMQSGAGHAGRDASVRMSGAQTADGKAAAGASLGPARPCEEEDENLLLMGLVVEGQATEEDRQQEQQQQEQKQTCQQQQQHQQHEEALQKQQRQQQLQQQQPIVDDLNGHQEHDVLLNQQGAEQLGHRGLHQGGEPGRKRQRQEIVGGISGQGGQFQAVPVQRSQISVEQAAEGAAVSGGCKQLLQNHPHQQQQQHGLCMMRGSNCASDNSTKVTDPIDEWLDGFLPPRPSGLCSKPHSTSSGKAGGVQLGLPVGRGSSDRGELDVEQHLLRADMGSSGHGMKQAVTNGAADLAQRPPSVQNKVSSGCKEQLQLITVRN